MTKHTKTTHTTSRSSHADTTVAPPVPGSAEGTQVPLTPTVSTSTGGTTASTTAASTSLLTMLYPQASTYVTQANAAVAQLQRDLPGLVSLPEAERKITGGRFRDGEAQALTSVLDTCDARPELVASLADLDNGVDPTQFETNLLRSRLELAMLLAPLSASLTQLASNLDDTVLYLNELTRQPILEAYAILKAVAKTDTGVKTAITPALDFYSTIAKNAAATRKKNAAAKAAAQPTQPTVASVLQPTVTAAPATPAVVK